MRLKALAEFYTLQSFAQLCNLNCLSNICQLFFVNWPRRGAGGRTREDGERCFPYYLGLKKTAVLSK